MEYRNRQPCKIWRICAECFILLTANGEGVHGYKKKRVKRAVPSFNVLKTELV